MPATPADNGVIRYLERVGRLTLRGVEEVGKGAGLIVESVYWLILGPSQRQPVRMPSVFAQMMEIGIRAIPIVLRPGSR